MNLPARVTDPGWPERLSDKDGYRYIRVRDGVTRYPDEKHSCLYVRECLNTYNKDHLYTPGFTQVEAELTMDPGRWLSPEDFRELGEPPITLPPD